MIKKELWVSPLNESLTEEGKGKVGIVGGWVALVMNRNMVAVTEARKW